MPRHPCGVRTAVRLEDVEMPANPGVVDHVQLQLAENPFGDCGEFQARLRPWN